MTSLCIILPESSDVSTRRRSESTSRAHRGLAEPPLTWPDGFRLPHDGREPVQLDYHLVEGVGVGEVDDGGVVILFDVVKMDGRRVGRVAWVFEEPARKNNGEFKIAATSL